MSKQVAVLKRLQAKVQKSINAFSKVADSVEDLLATLENGIGDLIEEAGADAAAPKAAKAPKEAKAAKPVKAPKEAKAKAKKVEAKPAKAKKVAAEAPKAPAVKAKVKIKGKLKRKPVALDDDSED